MQLVLLTGISGAGKSTAVKCFEDCGYYCVDNLPPALIENFTDLCINSKSRINKIAMVADIRGDYFFQDLVEVAEKIRKMNIDFKIVFLEAENDVIIERFKETRRRHPLSREGTISEDITQERKMLQDIKERADIIIDTTTLKSQQLYKQLMDLLIKPSFNDRMTIHLVSFGFKYGIPKDSDLLFDVRFLPNPFYVPAIKELTGNDPRVQNYVFMQPAANKFLEKIFDLMDFLIPSYISEGKTHLQISLGCTGGKHRSVSILNRIYDYLLKKNYEVVLRHRDIEK